MIQVQYSESLDDEILRCVHGDRAAFRTIYDATHERVSRAVRRMIRDDHLAEEVVADTYLQVWRHAAKFSPGRSSVPSWLVMMARSRALDALRRHGRVRGRHAPIEAASDVCTEEPEMPPEEAREITETIAACLETLPRNQQQAIRAAFFDGRTHREAAAYLNEPLGTVKTRIRLGLARLRQGLEGIG